VAEWKIPKLPPIADDRAFNKTRNSDNEQEIGRALRAAYDSALQEEIPPEMLDLLSKLR
jgi:Anti-sigma factor NepR